MTIDTVRCLVLADVSDKAWRGRIDKGQLTNPLYCYTDILLGKITYWMPGPTTTFGNPSSRIGVFGQLNDMAKALLGSEPAVVPSYSNEWSLQVSVADGVVTLCEHDGVPFTVNHRMMCRAVATAIDDALSLVKANRQDDLPTLLKTVDLLQAKLSEVALG